jgi:hypothetical protein
MAKDKEKFNPVAQHAKAEKNKSIKKNKAAVQAQRNERLSHRNPDRIQKQIDEMKAMQTAQGGELKPKDKQMLEQWEREVKTIRKARDGKDSAAMPARGSDGRSNEGAPGALGKRRRDEEQAERRANREWQPRERSPPTDEDIRRIPMPGDTPPPIPRRPYQAREQPAMPKVPVKKEYSSAPQIRDLQKEATAKFVPAAVAAKLKALKGEAAPGGRYLEPEEVDALEKAGYAGQTRIATSIMASTKTAAELEEEERAFERDLAAEISEDIAKVAHEAEKETEFRIMADPAGGSQAVKTERQLRHVEMEEVVDEDG